MKPVAGRQSAVLDNISNKGATVARTDGTKVVAANYVVDEHKCRTKLVILAIFVTHALYYCCYVI